MNFFKVSRLKRSSRSPPILLSIPTLVTNESNRIVMSAFHIYIKLRPCLETHPFFSKKMLSESMFLDCVHFLHTYFQCFQPFIQTISTYTLEVFKPDELLQMLDSRLNIKQKAPQKLLIITWNLLAYLLNELGRPELNMYLEEEEGQLKYKFGSWNKKLDQEQELLSFLKTTTLILLRDLKVLGLDTKKLHQSLSVFKFLAEKILSPNKKKKSKLRSVEDSSVSSLLPNLSSCSLTEYSTSSLAEASTLEKKFFFSPPLDLSDIGVYRLSYLRSQNDQLLRRIQSNSSNIEPMHYPPFPVRQVKNTFSPIPPSLNLPKNHVLEQSLYQVYPYLLQLQHHLHIFHPTLDLYSIPHIQVCSSKLKKHLSQAISVCLNHDYHTGHEFNPLKKDTSLFDVDTCIEKVTHGFTISTQFRERLKENLDMQFNKIQSQMDLIQLENKTYKEEHEMLLQTVSKEVASFQSQSSKFSNEKKQIQAQLACISHEMASMSSQLDDLKLNYSNEDALTILKVLEALLKRWQPEISTLAHSSVSAPL